MILQALHAYYQRKAADPDPARWLPAFGRELKEIPFILELTVDGRLADVTDTRDVVGKKKVGQRYLVPAAVKKTSGIAANLLWDNAEYVLGLPDAKKLADAEAKGKADEYRERLREMQAAFRARIEALPAAVREDEGVRAVLAFLDDAPAEAVTKHARGAEIAAGNPVLSFRLLDEPTLDLVCQRPALTAVGTDDAAESTPAATAMCLLTGEHAPPARLHAAIKGVWGAQTSGANIVSFNLDAFNSYGKTQGANAPISEAAAFAYTTALNHLLDRDSRQRVQVGDASTVFWAQEPRDADIEEGVGAALSDDVRRRLAAMDADDPDAGTDQIRALYESIHSGRFDDDRGKNRFYVLGLSPNAARIAVRFWHATTVKNIATRIREWFDDLEIDRAPYERPYPALKRVLAATCLATRERPGGDIDRLPATVEGDVLRAIFEGGELPALLLNGALERCRADASRKDDRTGRPVRHVTAVRAGLLKAGINRSLGLRSGVASRKELRVSLDKTNTDAPYLLGRLFAVFERVQEVAAERDLNRSIRDAYFGAAMAMPRSVFPRLVKLNQIHLRDVKRSRLSTGRYFDALLREINDKFDAKTAYDVAIAGLRDQGIFTVGYYHQRQDFYRRSEDKPDDVMPAADAGNAAVPIETDAETLSDTIV